ncbi:hypothetical protein [Pseudomonas helleri]|uniref:hypothetical protein n=1 Tax=Pseudomonas helleri TaxID=1608996 RepID=UPI00129745B3|nr:hypothetical protein [Pseudomonas helleri]MQT39251.1 hypothetical protein [Pseudomonas helleri]MQU61430.1 hypothetical protein [Pseudomonas helleri]
MTVLHSAPATASLKELSYLRDLCEYFSFFSVIESEKLEKPMKWGASNLVAHYKKHHLGRYEDDISKVKIHSLLKKALTLKDIAKNNVFKSGRRARNTETDTS